MQLVIGPAEGPGVSAHIGGKTGVLSDAKKGVCVIAGQFERGIPFTLLHCPTETEADNQVGGRVEGLEAPHLVDGFFFKSRRKGELWCVRVTDGNEIPAMATVYNRLPVPTACMDVFAKSGGSWAGKKRTLTATLGSPPYSGTTLNFSGGAGDVDDIEALADVWKGGSVTKTDSPEAGPWTVVSSTADAGSPYAGTLTLESDAILTSLSEGDTIEVTLVNNGKALSYEILDASRNRTTGFRMKFYYEVKSIPGGDFDNLSMSQSSNDYFVKRINNAASNWFARVVDKGTGDTSSHRPAQGWAASVSVAYDAATGQSTLTDTGAFAGLTLKGGYLVPNAGSATVAHIHWRYRIVSNTDDAIVVDGDITSASQASASNGDYYRWEKPVELEGGYNGGTPSDADYMRVFDPDTSPINILKKRGMMRGLVHIVATSLSKTVIGAQRNYCEGVGYKFLVGTPVERNTDAAAEDWFLNEVGKSNVCEAFYPSHFYINNSDGGDLIRVSMLGDHLGQIAYNAVTYDGYHQSASGIVKTSFDRIVALGWEFQDEDRTAAAMDAIGVHMIRPWQGKWVVWGAKNLFVETTWQWKNQINQLLHYGHVWQEQFVSELFDLNDPINWAYVVGEITEYLKKEYAKRALRQDLGGFEAAAQIRGNKDTTTSSDIEAGDQNIEVIPCPAGITNRLRILVGKGPITITEVQEDLTA